MSQTSELISQSSLCPHCGEAIETGDEVSRSASDVYHHECLVRMIAGSAAHQLGECSCNGGTREDPPGMTRRQAARVAYDVFKEMKHA